MGRHAHRRAPGDERETGSTARERARVRWEVERPGRLHGSPGDQSTDLARHLQRHLRHLPVVMLHDLLLPDGCLVVEHLAVGPGGVTVIQGTGPVGERLHVVEPVRARVAALRATVAGVAAIAGAVCLEPDDGAGDALPVHVGDVLIAGPKLVAELAARHGDLSDVGLAALVDRLRASCPPAPPGLL